PNKKKSKIHKFRIRPRNPQSSFWSITAGIAALLVVGVLVAFYFSSSKSVVARLILSEGYINVSRGGHTITFQNNMDLQQLDSITVADNSHAVLKFGNEETTVSIKGPAAARVYEGELNDRYVELTSGSLSAQVAHQASGKTFNVATPKAGI